MSDLVMAIGFAVVFLAATGVVMAVIGGIGWVAYQISHDYGIPVYIGLALFSGIVLLIYTDIKDSH